MTEATETSQENPQIQPQADAPQGDDAIIAEMNAMIAEREAKVNEPDAEPEDSEPDASPAPQEAASEPPPASEDKEVVVDDAVVANIQAMEERAMAAISKAEAASMERVKAAEAKLEEMGIGGLSDLEAKAARGDYLGVLQALQVPEELLVAAAKDIWSGSPEAAKDPKAREVARRARQEQHTKTELEKIRDENRKLREQYEADKAAAESARQAQEYMSGFESVLAKEAAPNYHRLAANNPERARAKLEEAVLAVADRVNGIPKHADVVRALENYLQAELDSWGVDRASTEGLKPVHKAETPEAAKPVEKASPPSEETKPLDRGLSEEDKDAQLLREYQELIRNQT